MERESSEQNVGELIVDSTIKYKSSDHGKAGPDDFLFMLITARIPIPLGVGLVFATRWARFNGLAKILDSYGTSQYDLQISREFYSNELQGTRGTRLQYTLANSEYSDGGALPVPADAMHLQWNVEFSPLLYYTLVTYRQTFLGFLAGVMGLVMGLFGASRVLFRTTSVIVRRVQNQRKRPGAFVAGKAEPGSRKDTVARVIQQWEQRRLPPDSDGSRPQKAPPPKALDMDSDRVGNPLHSKRNLKG